MAEFYVNVNDVGKVLLEYIGSEEFEKAVESTQDNGRSGVICGIAMAGCVIMTRCPTYAADVVERGVGKWLTVKEEADGPLKEFLETLPHYRCSACDYKFIAMGKGEKPHKYCPNCGTRMVSDD